jgi:hypothetical protein
MAQQIAKKSLQMHLLPLKMSIINDYLSNNLNVKGLRIGDKYASVLSDVLRQNATLSQSMQKVKLSSNNLKGKSSSFKELLASLPSKVRQVSLSNNAVGVEGADILYKELVHSARFE